jgi:hypothetical protein
VTPLLSGGTGPYEWKANGLPSGLTIDKDTGQITGVPAVKDVNKTLTPTITVTDYYKLKVDVEFTWQIVPALVAAVAPQSSVVGGLVDLTTNVATGGFGTYTWSATGLPIGLTLDPATGAVRGSPTTAQVYTVVYTVTDQIGSNTSATVVWIVT